MGFKEDLERVQASRTAEREEMSRLQEELARLLDGAAIRLHEAADVLAAAGVPTAEARLAHKQRQNWQWPAGRARIHGWILDCGDQPAMLRSDGWLAAVHHCSDAQRTLCACAFRHATDPLPRRAMTLVRREPDGDAPSEETAGLLLAIRTKIRGERTDLPFDAWLIEQVADLLESRTGDRARSSPAS